MAKRIQLVLNQDVNKLGRTGDLVEVAPGYARNYLIPQGMAYRATPGILKQVERRRELERQRQLELKQQALQRKTALEAVGTFRIAAQAGEEGALFGSVTATDVAELIAQTTAQEVDRRLMDVPEIRKIGTYGVSLKLHADVTAVIKIEVVPE